MGEGKLKVKSKKSKKKSSRVVGSFFMQGVSRKAEGRTSGRFTRPDVLVAHIGRNGIKDLNLSKGSPDENSLADSCFLFHAKGAKKAKDATGEDSSAHHQIIKLFFSATSP